MRIEFVENEQVQPASKGEGSDGANSRSAAPFALRFLEKVKMSSIFNDPRDPGTVDCCISGGTDVMWQDTE